MFKWDGDSCRYAACVYLEEAPRYFQLRKEFYAIYDTALQICPEYSDAYRAQSVGYLKTGNFIKWKQLMDKAVEIDPLTHLSYRGWCKFQFLRDYEGALSDFNLLKEMSVADIGYSQNGVYHLEIVRGLCYRMLGEKQRAIEVIEEYLLKQDVIIGLYDYMHLGVTFLEMEEYEKAVLCFLKQEQTNDRAENRYYKAIALKLKGEYSSCFEELKIAEQFYKDQKYMFDNYTHPVDKVFLREIILALKS